MNAWGCAWLIEKVGGRSCKFGWKSRRSSLPPSDDPPISKKYDSETKESPLKYAIHEIKENNLKNFSLNFKRARFLPGKENTPVKTHSSTLSCFSKKWSKASKDFFDFSKPD